MGVKRKTAQKPKGGKKGTSAPRGAPQLGSKVHYSGWVWTIIAMSPDPHNVGKFVDLERDDDPAIVARVHSINLAEDTTGGFTWQEHRRQPGSKHAGDPRYPLVEEHRDKHTRFQNLVDRIAEGIFEKSRWGDNGSWDGLEERQKDKLRRLVRGLILNLPVPDPPGGITLTQVRTFVTNRLPQDLKDWLAANPQ